MTEFRKLKDSQKVCVSFNDLPGVWEWDILRRLVFYIDLNGLSVYTNHPKVYSVIITKSYLKQYFYLFLKKTLSEIKNHKSW